MGRSLRGNPLQKSDFGLATLATLPLLHQKYNPFPILGLATFWPYLVAMGLLQQQFINILEMVDFPILGFEV